MKRYDFQSGTRHKKISIQQLTIDHSFGLLHHTTHANVFLTILALICISAAFFIFNSSRPEVVNGGPGPSPEEIFEYSKMQR